MANNNPTSKTDTTPAENKQTLFGLALHQLYCDAFGVEFEKSDRQQWLEEMQVGEKTSRLIDKMHREDLDNSIRKGEDIDSEEFNLKVYAACKLSEKYAEYKSAHTDNKFRESLTIQEQENILKFEDLTADYVLVDQLPINQAMAKASRYIR